jgi:putative membrane-bound dehydrogenase-like protein
MSRDDADYSPRFEDKLMRWPAMVALLLAVGMTMWADAPPPTGPATEKRFPPLQIAPGFKATLFACDPFIEYPSVIAAGPKANQLFVAIDYMTGLGVEIVRRDEIRLIEDTDGDGYADKATVFATGFNSIQGLAYHDGVVYVMHAPYLTALRDTDGDGKADERKDLLVGLGLKPEDNPPRLHCANGVAVGHDGWLYLALGDHGCNVLRPEGDRLIYNGGGILRCRPDGRDLHVLATGLRNIYDIALDNELNVFVRDNENDGGTYMIRVCHSFFGADHGYPYLYDEWPDEALPPLADLGLGSSAGGVCYLETAFPKEFRGDLFFCEWGRALMRYRPERQGSGFAPIKEFEFAAGSPMDPYGFKPTDVVVQRDGALMVSDWADGQRPKRGRGRIYRITPQDGKRTDPNAKARGLDSESYFARCDAQAEFKQDAGRALAVVRGAFDKKNGLGRLGRLHAVWILAHTASTRQEAIADLLTVARSDPDTSVRAQAVRAIGDLSDPVLVNHRLDAGRGSAKVAAQLTAIPTDPDRRVRLETVIALGRLRWAQAPTWLAAHMIKSDATLSHAIMQTLRRCDNWPEVLKLLDLPEPTPIRAIALRAVSDQAETSVVDGLLDRLRDEKNLVRRRDYADVLTRVYKKPGPWKYWGYRPAPRPANTVAWERTDAIEKALDRVLADSDRTVRLAILQRMQREKIPTRLATLKQWLDDEIDAPRVTALLAALRTHPLADCRDSLRGKLSAASGEIRAAVLEMFTDNREPVGDALPKLLDDPDARVRAAAVTHAGKLTVRAAADSLLQRAKDAEPTVRRASLVSLRELREPRVVALAVAALKDSATLPAALQCLSDLGGPEHAQAVAEAARQNPSAEVLPLAIGMLSRWSRAAKGSRHAEIEHSLAVLQGASGTVARWCVRGPMPASAAASILEQTSKSNGNAPSEVPSDWDTVIGTGLEARIRPSAAKNANADDVWFGVSDVFAPEPTAVQFLGGSNGAMQVWRNGRPVHRHSEPRSFAPDADRFDAMLDKGVNRLLVQVAPVKGQAEFHLRFRRKSSTANHEQLIQAALSRTGNIERGRKLFLDVGKTQCLKCHRLGDQGERIGPELTGVGNRFARVYLIESILEPSRTIAPSYETLNVQLKDGRVALGVRVEETADTLTLADNQGQKHMLAKSNIDEIRSLPTSTMPEGLERPLSTDDFVDLIAFLASQK